MVAESADRAHMGWAFGLHKALDMAGSAVGILAAYWLVRGVDEEMGRWCMSVSCGDG